MKFLKNAFIITIGSWILGGILFFSIQYHYDFRSALLKTALFPLITTEWASGFTEKRFSAVKVGMGQKQVIQLLGQPLEKSGCNKANKNTPPESQYICLWRYTNSWLTDHFDRRAIYFNKKDKVGEIKRHIWID